MATPGSPPPTRQSAGRVLVVDDEYSVRDSLEGWFRMDGYDVASAADAKEALGKLQDHGYDVVLLDIRMPGIDGLELQRRIHALDPRVVVIMITAYASVDTAVQALKEGAFDYVTKPIDPDHLSQLVRRGLEQRGVEDAGGDGAGRAPHVVAESAAMRTVLARAQAAADSDAPVTIRGESGTGRTHLARFVHARSGRRNFPFVSVQCAAFDDVALESELFGHEKLAFEGAKFRRKGKLEMADGGTLLLQDVEAMPLRLQSALLQALERGEFHRLGGSSPLRWDVRLVASTTAELEQEVRDGRFREELFYRLHVVTLEIPPLRERVEDIPALAAALLASASEQAGRDFTGFDRRAIEALTSRPWPGNARELANAIERAVAVGKPPTVRLQDLP